MMNPGDTAEQTKELNANGFITTLFCVKDIDMACLSAKKLADKKVLLIELFGAFIDEMISRSY